MFAASTVTSFAVSIVVLSTATSYPFEMKSTFPTASKSDFATETFLPANTLMFPPFLAAASAE